ncbi:hypothetical protein U4I65_08625 [Stenotrophomonas maltophilia]|uniref:hypothetical protein n=1 Tax=Stenotrophomonas maltophilia TaxID=40324 RepID=UPI002ACCDA98|nr:hypothetical protein [Stenotrophomonas maltophilia]MDZ5815096.1 hypothetical protein [Stenotrophomonas maltophilia]
MLIPDPIRPYVGLIRVALWCVLAGGLFVGGCNHGTDRQVERGRDALAKVEKARDAAQSDAAENLRAVNACGQLLSDINDQTQRSIDDAARAKAAAEQAASRAEAAAVAGQRRAAAAEKALQDAKNTPACRSQLEQKLCDAIPLL